MCNHHIKTKDDLRSYISKFMIRMKDNLLQCKLTANLNNRINAVVVSDIGRVRSNNEDNYILGRHINEQFLDHSELLEYRSVTREKCYLAGVFDGIGGAEAGEIASKTAVECFRESFERISAAASKEKMDCILRETFSEANNRINLLQKKMGFIGTTGTVLLYYDGEFKIFHLGDSRAYLFHNDALYQITKDDTLSNMKIEMGIYLPDDPRVEWDKHKLTCFIGKNETMKNLELEESEWIPVVHGDQILLCSDGLSDMCSDNAISYVIQRNKSVQETAMDLVSLAKENGGEDNITCVLIKVR